MTRTVLIAVTAALALAACGSPEERAAGHLERAQELFEAEDYTKAKLEAQNAAQIEPKNAEARFLLARIAEIDGEFRQAVGHLLVAVDSDPDFVKARVRLGNYYFLGRNEKEAAEQAEAAMAVAPDDASVRLLNARVNFLRKDLDGAWAETEKALELDPGLADAIMFKAGLAAERQDFDQAFEVIDAGIAQVATDESQPLRQFRLQLLNRTGQLGLVETELQALAQDFPDTEAYQYALASFYVSQGRANEAESVLERLVELDPEDVDRKLAYVRFLASQKGLEPAEATLKDYVAAEPDVAQFRLALGSLYESAERDDDARDTYQALAAREPLSPEGLKARNRIVAIELRANDVEAARDAVERIIADAPDNADALLYRAAFNFIDAEFDDAIADLRLVLRKEENSERALLLLARSYLRSGDAVLAQDAYRRLLAVNPKHPRASRELAALLAGQGDTAEAEKVLRARLEVEPEDTAAAAGLVQTLIAQDQLEEAESEARKLVDLNANNALAQFQMGRVMQAKGSPDEAIAAYRSTLAGNPGATAALQGLVSVLVENNRSDEALEYLDEHIGANPEQLEAKLLLGAVHATRGETDAARAAYEEVIDAEPRAVRAYTALAATYPEGSDERAAVYRRGLEAIPGSPDMGLLLASHYERQNEIEQAIEIYEDLLDANADNIIAVNNLAALLLDYRDDAESHDRALQLARELERSDQPAFLDTLGWAYYRNGEYPNAVRYLERAVAGAGQVPQLRYHLGMAYARNNNPVGARQELRRALEQSESDFPGRAEAQETLAELEAS